MPEKHRKRPNTNAKALENWESEGGAPASDNRSTKRKRPRVLNQITKAQPLTDHEQNPNRTWDQRLCLWRTRRAGIQILGVRIMNPTANWNLIPEHLRSSVEG